MNLTKTPQRPTSREVGLFPSCAVALQVFSCGGMAGRRSIMPRDRDDESSIIVLDRFVQATRDSGYKGTLSALSELVDNSIQAGSKRVEVRIASDGGGDWPITVAILDDGVGMERKALRQALRFGGSSRFNERQGLGRFGMGLPNSSLSQARRVEVFSWRKGGGVLRTFLDVDEIAAGEMNGVPEPKAATLSVWASEASGESGTLVLWSKCDRLDHVRVSTLVRKLKRGLGQIFRHFLWNGVSIAVNDEKVDPLDPLFLRGANAIEGTTVYGTPMTYEVAAPIVGGGKPKTGTVTVTFAELPIHTLHALSNEEKRERGISNGAGVSIVRAGREVDFGWFFMGGKRRENYDDWWRCEVSFDPVLDEVFGITHTKQQIRPLETLLESLVPDMESAAKVLNARVRQAHTRLKAGEATRAAEETAATRERLLPPLPKSVSAEPSSPFVKTVLKQHPNLRNAPASEDGLEYRIVEADVKGTELFNFAVVHGKFVVGLNASHPFSRRVYKPLCEFDSPEAKQARVHVELMLTSMARAEAAATKSADRRSLEENRQRWSDILATYLNR